MLFELENENIRKLLSRAEFGVERESLRVCQDGSLAQSEHPFQDNKHIDRDFCENQVEFISDVFSDPLQLNEQLLQLQRTANSELLKRDELLWPFSNPPRIGGEEEIPVARYHGSLKSKSVYRRYLAGKYGKTKMLFSGIHLNFSFTGELFEKAFRQEGDQLTAVKNDIYLRLAKRLTQYAWLVVFLTAASPVADPSVGTDSFVYSSIRCSERGYWNYFTPILDYSDLPGYAASIKQYIDDGNLRSASELYYPVRLKPRGENSLEALQERGINHLELRVIDVNPLSPTGILVEDIRFIHLLMLYLASLPDLDFDKTRQLGAIKDIKAASVYGDAGVHARAAAAVREIKAFAKKYFPEFTSAAQYQEEKLAPGGSYAEIIGERFSENYMQKGLELAREYQRSVGYV